MIDYKKAYDVIEKKLSDTWAMPYSKENYEMIERYIKTLYYLNELYEEKTPESETAIAIEPLTMTEAGGDKSEFVKTVWGIIKAHSNKKMIGEIIKEIDKFVEMMKTLHSGRYNEFISKLKEMK